MCFSVRGLGPGGGLLRSGPSPRCRRLLPQPAEPHAPEDREKPGKSAPRAEDWR